MRKQSKPYIFFIGAFTLVAGAIMRAFFVESDFDTVAGNLWHIPVVLIGFGSSLTAVGIVYFIVTRWIRKRNPGKAKQIEIKVKDERNVRLLEKSGYTTWYITMFTLALLSLSLVVLQLFTAFWLSIGAFTVHVTAFFLCGFIYDRKI